jgi:hypothetical protein
MVVEVTIHHFLKSVHLHNLTATLENFIIGLRQALKYLSIPPLTAGSSATRDHITEMIV